MERVTEPVHRFLIIKLIFILLTLTGFCNIHARAIFSLKTLRKTILINYNLISVGKCSKTDKKVFHTKH